MAGIDPATGAIAGGIEAQAEQAQVNLAAVLSAAGASWRTTIRSPCASISTPSGQAI
jgi:2-iminobutanoate/2-iminopropanoate deaminase